MNETLLLQHCDPRQQFSPYQVLALINLHALLVKEIVIPDNFLISKLFFEIYNNSSNNSLPVLFSEKVLNIASRNNLDHSLINLRNDLHNKSIMDKYIPFEGKKEGLQLYNYDQFKDYIKKMDQIINKRKRELKSWSPDDLGQTLNTQIAEYAKTNISGLKSSQAIEVFNKIGTLTNVTPSRSFYYSIIDEIADSNDKFKLKELINTAYITNLPNYLNIGISFSNKQLIEDFQFNHFAHIENNDIFNNGNILHELEGTLLNFDFLYNLHPESILKIREFEEFSTLQNSIAHNSPDLAKNLTTYITRVSNEAPYYYGSYRAKINNLKKLETGKIALIEALDFYNIVTIEPISQKIAGILSFFLKKVKYPNSRLEEIKDVAEAELSSKKEATLIKNLGELIHKLE